ncbi:MAG: hypothetical protein FGF50_11175 [Candidatus Brockarchaeota archaeon]|nr:hypothetical protein [Candidatus Brockarchaeota archaeon]
MRNGDVDSSRFTVSEEDYRRVLDVVKRYVKCEDELVELVFHVCLSAWTDEPLNLFLKGESSSGKTWIVTNVVKLFPKGSVWLLGGLSPTALVHMTGLLVDEDGNPIEKPRAPPLHRLKDASVREKYQSEMEEYRRRLEGARWLVDMARKVLVFLEAPSRETFQRLRPVLSHDELEISYKFTDKADGRLKTSNVTIRGFPAMICCSTDVDWMEDMVTRSLTVSPKLSTEKFKAAHGVTSMRFLSPMEPLVRGRLYADAGGLTLKMTSDGVRALVPYARILEGKFTSREPRSMRDFKYFMTLIEVHTAVSPHPTIYIPALGPSNIATLRDLRDVERMWRGIYRQTITGLPSACFEIYDVVRQIAREGVDPTVANISSRYSSVKGMNITADTLRHYLRQLDAYGLVEAKTNPNDKREKVYYPLESRLEGAEAEYSNAVQEGFSKVGLEAWLNEVAGQIGEYYNTAEPYVVLSIPDGETPPSFKYPFPEEAVERLHCFIRK